MGSLDTANDSGPSAANLPGITELPKQGSDIKFQILGEPGRDNALYVKLSNNRFCGRFLFDCGSNCLQHIGMAEIQAVNALFISHLHIDHIAGFDDLLRLNYDRDKNPLRIFGPPGTSNILHHRLQGVLWNLVDNSKGRIIVTDIGPQTLTTHEYKLNERFAMAHFVSEEEHNGRIIDNQHYKMDVILLDHGTPSAAYVLREADGSSINKEKFASMGLKQEPWVGKLKDVSIPDSTEIEVMGSKYNLGDLRRELLETKRGESIGYLTDFRLRDDSKPQLIEMIRSCDTVVCENNYRDSHVDLAVKHHHSTTSEVAGLAKDAGIKQLVLFHISDRYTPEEWLALLGEVKANFPKTYFPPEWGIHK